MAKRRDLQTRTPESVEVPMPTVRVPAGTPESSASSSAPRPFDLLSLRPWSFLSRHAQVLLAVARRPDARINDLTATLGLSERALYRMLADLQKAGYVRRERNGRCNRYVVDRRLPLEDPVVEGDVVADLLRLLPRDEVGEAARKRSH